MSPDKLTGLSIPVLLLICVNNWADTIQLPLTDDSWINANQAGTNFGSGEDIFVHNWGPKHGLVRFDASSISGQTVNNATLELYLDSIAASGVISIHAITSGWNEETVTWSNQPPSEPTATAIISITMAESGSVVAADVTSAVQRWADGSLADAGFMIVTSDGIKAFFDAKEMVGGVSSSLTVESANGAPTLPPDTATILDLSSSCTIDEPGYYLLDRNWLICESGYCVNEEPNSSCHEIHITASVTVDFRGFTIEIMGEDDTDPFINLDGVNATFRNGSVHGFADAIWTWAGASLTLENMYVFGSVRTGDYGKVWNSNLPNGVFEATLSVGSNSIVRNSRIGGGGDGPPCLGIGGTSVIVQNNLLYCEGDILLYGSDSTFTGNRVVSNRTTSSSAAVNIKGDRNIISRNILDALSINGMANIIDGNILMEGGISFGQTGNFFGNNRVKGLFDGTEGQVDWGGNVSF